MWSPRLSLIASIYGSTTAIFILKLADACTKDEVPHKPCRHGFIVSTVTVHVNSLPSVMPAKITKRWKKLGTYELYGILVLLLGVLELDRFHKNGVNIFVTPGK